MYKQCSERPVHTLITVYLHSKNVSNLYSYGFNSGVTAYALILVRVATSDYNCTVLLWSVVGLVSGLQLRGRRVPD